MLNVQDVEAPIFDQAPNEIWEGGWILEEKCDGERIALEIGVASSQMTGRNRQDFLKGVDKAGEFRHREEANLHLAAVGSTYLAGTILDGELTEVFKQNGEYDEGTQERRELGYFTGYTVWGCLFLRGEDVRDLTEAQRYDLTKFVVETLHLHSDYAREKIRMIERVPATKEALKRFFDAGLEGAVAKKEDGILKKNQRTCSTWWKLKTDHTMDAIIIGVTEAKEGGSGISGVKPKLNGKAASFIIGLQKSGQIVEVGKMSNLPEDAIENGVRNFEAYRNRVVEVTVSGFNGKAFRWPRFRGWRNDKTPKDCLFSEQVGKGGKKYGN